LLLSLPFCCCCPCCCVVVVPSPPFIVPTLHCPSCSLSSMFIVPAIHCWSYVVLVPIVISTSISPYEQWLADGVVVLCDMVIVQERACCHPASRGSQRQRRACTCQVVGGQRYS
jgi:hypothetical protein